MKIKKSSEIGFCSGVKRAITLAEELSRSTEEPLLTIGPLVHNPRVVAMLAKKGVSPLKDIQDLSNHKGRLVLPTHGLGLKELEAIKRKGMSFHDGTCPIVGNLQQKVKKLSKEGYAIIIFGEAEHPEVKGALGWFEGDTTRALAAIDFTLVSRLTTRVKHLALLSQTTQNVSSYIKFCQEILKIYLPKMLEIKILNTICPEVKRRQAAAKELAQTSDLMLIVGGKDSANTRRLAEICREAGVQVQLIEEAEEIKADWLQDKACIGIAAGTSTPLESVDEVEKRVKILSRQ